MKPNSSFPSTSMMGITFYLHFCIYRANLEKFLKPSRHPSGIRYVTIVTMKCYSKHYYCSGIPCIEMDNSKPVILSCRFRSNHCRRQFAISHLSLMFPPSSGWTPINPCLKFPSPRFLPFTHKMNFLPTFLQLSKPSNPIRRNQTPPFRRRLR